MPRRTCAGESSSETALTYSRKRKIETSPVTCPSPETDEENESEHKTTASAGSEPADTKELR